MDMRWPAPTLERLMDYKVVLHPTADFTTIRNGAATDGFDLTPFVNSGKQSLKQLQLGLSWNHELAGVNQPKPGQLIELQSDSMPLWIGIVDSISSYTVMHGERSMQLIAVSRDSQKIWKESRRVTKLYPQMTDFSVIAFDIANAVGLTAEEINMPPSSYYTAHSNTQLADMSAWDMLSTLLLPMGLTQFMNWGGILKTASRQLQGRTADIKITEDFLIQVNASREKAPTTRIVLHWLDPNLTKAEQQGRRLGDAVITTGFFTPYVRKNIPFSPDKTQRATATHMVIKQSCNAIGIPVALENYSQTDEVQGEIELISLGWTQGIMAMALAIKLAAFIPDGVSLGHTIPIGRKAQAAAEVALLFVMMSMGTGVYEIWGQPFDWVHARNLTEAYAKNAPQWVDNPVEINSDFVMNESHAQAFATRELIYQYKAANGWSVRIVDDRRVEKGDILQFPDGTKMYVDDFSRNIGHGSENVLEVTGFIV